MSEEPRHPPFTQQTLTQQQTGHFIPGCVDADASQPGDVQTPHGLIPEFDESSSSNSGIIIEEVADAPVPPRARVSDAPEPEPEPERKRDYLEGFLQEQPGGLAAHEPGGALYDAVIAALRDIYDPEIPVNIYDLGLIYGVEISDEAEAVISMTLTTPHCPVAESMPGEVELRVDAVPGIRDCVVNLVWDPPWDPAKMSDEARLELGML